MPARRQDGQATVELALLLAPILVIVLAIIQVGLVWRDQLMVIHAGREAARAAAVNPAPGAARSAALDATSLDPSRLSVEVVGRAAPGGLVTIRVVYGPPSSLPLFASLLAGRRLSSVATMLVEVSGSGAGSGQTRASGHDPPEHLIGPGLVEVFVAPSASARHNT
ncbi:MAG: pilus assembly protein [Actinomycetia bacterium]|nr:pilus assembly protein [Actinomycetes bacterium]MCP4961566.1 pilus assembly protein [Actinomycetes bacterium]